MISSLCPSPGAEVVDEVTDENIPTGRDITTHVRRDGTHTLMARCGSVFLPIGMHPAFRPLRERAANRMTPNVDAAPSQVATSMLEAA